MLERVHACTPVRGCLNVLDQGSSTSARVARSMPVHACRYQVAIDRSSASLGRSD